MRHESRLLFGARFGVTSLALAMVACSGSPSGSSATPTPPNTVTYALTVNSTNPASGVTVAAAPADNGGLTTGSTGFSLTYNAGTGVTLTAAAIAGGKAFSSWTGCGSASTVTCTVSMTANTTVTANYSTAASATYTLTVNSTNPSSGVAIVVAPRDVTGSSNGSSSFSRTYNAGSSVTLTAPSLSGSNTFSSWTGCTSISELVCTIAINASTTVTANYVTPAPPNFLLTVNSTNPSSGVAIGIAPSDANGAGSGSTGFVRSYAAGTTVNLTAPAASGTNTFVSWSGCTSTTTTSCTVLSSANTTVTANYSVPGATSVSVSPNPASAAIGTTLQFTATVTANGSANGTVTWLVTGLSGYTGSVGNITPAGLYTTPSPAPSSVTIVATSVADTTKSASVTLTLAPPPTTSGPALTVDVGSPTHKISPEIYGVNAYALDTDSVKSANPSVIRWGGDNTSRYNYLANTTNAASDYYFESFASAGGQWPDGNFNDLVTNAAALGAEVVGNAPVIGWVTSSDTSSSACSFQKSSYPNQQSFNGVCGSGVGTDGKNLVGNNTIAAITSLPEPPPMPPAAGTPIAASWIGDWVTSLKTQFGPANPSTGAGRGVAHWDLDNEPEYWSGVHRDVHPLPMTYDEVTRGGIGTALAIKTADPTALVSGPVISGWYNYFYSAEDVSNGYGTGPCYKPWGNPLDRKAHGGAPLIEYYLQQMKAAETLYGKRLLDYVDIHTYFAANYNGKPTGLTVAGDTAEQIARLNSTRVFWDPTYSDPAYTQPNYATDANYAAGCSPAAQPPQLIPMLQSWVASNYPGTKTSIDEYNFGGTEAISGALAQADILGIFGKYGLDMAMLWPADKYSTQIPGNQAFAIYRNYDGVKSGFGDNALTSATGDQGKLAVYAAKRTSDGALTIVVINKTYGDLTSTLTLPGLTATGQASVFLYSNANLGAITAQPAQAVTPPSGSNTASTLNKTYPAQSITLLVIPTI